MEFVGELCTCAPCAAHSNKTILPTNAAVLRTRVPGIALAGVGVVFRQKKTGPKDLLVVAVVPDGPGKGSGVLPGQRLIKIDGKDVSGLDNTDIAVLMLGAPGTTVDFVLQNENGELVNATLTRRLRKQTN